MQNVEKIKEELIKEKEHMQKVQTRIKDLSYGKEKEYNQGYIDGLNYALGLILSKID